MAVSEDQESEKPKTLLHKLQSSTGSSSYVYMKNQGWLLCLWSHPSTTVHIKQRTAAPHSTMLWTYAPFLGLQSRSPGQNLRKDTGPTGTGLTTAIGTWRVWQPHAAGQLLFLSSGSCQNEHKSGCSWTCCVELYSNGLIHQHSLLKHWQHAWSWGVCA